LTSKGISTRFINLRTEIPGPRSKELLELHSQYVPKAINPHIPVMAQRAEGALVIDVDGNRLIDMMGGVGVLNVGYSHPRVLAAVQDQVERFLHTDYSILPYEPLIRLAQRLAELAPGTGPKKAFFFNSGAEAVENAVKIAKAYTGRPGVISFEGGFHGRTWMALTLTGRVTPYKNKFAPFVPDVHQMPFPYTYRKPHPVSDEELGEICLDAIERAFHTRIDPESVAAVIVEPIQGEAGFIVPPANFLPGLQALCRRYGIVFIVDEVQTGFGRTGHMFASTHFGIEPDLMVVAKSLASGLPLSGVVGRAEIMDAVGDGGIGGTYVGNPVACAAALAVLDVIAEEDLAARAQVLGRRIRERFERMQEASPLIGDVRGVGAMMAMELVRDRESREPAPEETSAILLDAARRGVLLLRAGLYNNCIRLLMPLTMPLEQLDEALDVLESVILDAAVQPKGGR